MLRLVRHPLAALALAAALAACTTAQGGARADSAPAAAPAAAPQQGGAMNSLTDAERAAGWRLLFDGRSLSAWRGYKADTISSVWRVADGTMTKDRPGDDLVSREQFGDFELVLDWKVSPRGNAGLFYRATEEYEKIYWSATEYQLLDDPGHRDGQNPLTSAGAAYGLYPAKPGVVKPAGEWNTTRVVARGTHVEHWLNGQKLLEYDYGSPDWVAKVQASKFKDWPNYGRATRGHIGIQGDHGGVLALRNIKLRELR